QLARGLVGIQYERNDIALSRGMFRVRGDVVDIIPVNEEEHGLRVGFFGDQIEKISETLVTTGRVLRQLNHAALYPATHYATNAEALARGLRQIEADLAERVAYFEKEGRLLEAQRIAQRTNYDLEMLREIGFVSGIENYSRYFDGRKPGEPPFSLLDYFPRDFICFIDESHVTVPQIRGMFNGDRARKTQLVDYGFRLPSAFDNRPLTFEEFEQRIPQAVYVSATPGEYEAAHSLQTVEQIIRPTGLLDPKIIVRPATGQVDDLVGEINSVVERGFRVLVTTLTKAMAERLTDYLRELGMRVRYLHSDIKTMERMELLRDLRLGAYDTLVGINLLREGLDLPEVALVAILDADKEGFLRSETSLVQTVGRAARNTEGRVIMYADSPTDSMMRAIGETNRRRAIQEAYNRKNGITPETINSAVRELIAIAEQTDDDARDRGLSPEERAELALSLEDRMLAAAQNLDFEQAAKLRDQLFSLRGEQPIEKKQPQPVRRRRARTRK
ncbi:MAG TPA: helicase-related protein, partial [Clostridia bacterium]|nr:helicase-related protein [Clostridia bacterium]